MTSRSLSRKLLCGGAVWYIGVVLAVFAAGFFSPATARAEVSGSKNHIALKVLSGATSGESAGSPVYTYVLSKYGKIDGIEAMTDDEVNKTVDLIELFLVQMIGNQSYDSIYAYEQQIEDPDRPLEKAREVLTALISYIDAQAVKGDGDTQAAKKRADFLNIADQVIDVIEGFDSAQLLQNDASDVRYGLLYKSSPGLVYDNFAKTIEAAKAVALKESKGLPVEDRLSGDFHLKDDYLKTDLAKLGWSKESLPKTVRDRSRFDLPGIHRVLNAAAAKASNTINRNILEARLYPNSPRLDAPGVVTKPGVMIAQTDSKDSVEKRPDLKSKAPAGTDAAAPVAPAKDVTPSAAPVKDVAPAAAPSQEKQGKTAPASAPTKNSSVGNKSTGSTGFDASTPSHDTGGAPTTAGFDGQGPGGKGDTGSFDAPGKEGGSGVSVGSGSQNGAAPEGKGVSSAEGKGDEGGGTGKVSDGQVTVIGQDGHETTGGNSETDPDKQQDKDRGADCTNCDNGRDNPFDDNGGEGPQDRVAVDVSGGLVGAVGDLVALISSQRNVGVFDLVASWEGQGGESAPEIPKGGGLLEVLQGLLDSGHGLDSERAGSQAARGGVLGLVDLVADWGLDGNGGVGGSDGGSGGPPKGNAGLVANEVDSEGNDVGPKGPQGGSKTTKVSSQRPSNRSAATVVSRTGTQTSRAITTTSQQKAAVQTPAAVAPQAQQRVTAPQAPVAVQTQGPVTQTQNPVTKITAPSGGAQVQSPTTQLQHSE